MSDGAPGAPLDSGPRPGPAASPDTGPQIIRQEQGTSVGTTAEAAQGNTGPNVITKVAVTINAGGGVEDAMAAVADDRLAKPGELNGTPGVLGNAEPVVDATPQADPRRDLDIELLTDKINGSEARQAYIRQVLTTNPEQVRYWATQAGANPDAVAVWAEHLHPETVSTSPLAPLPLETQTTAAAATLEPQSTGTTPLTEAPATSVPNEFNLPVDAVPPPGPDYEPTTPDAAAADAAEGEKQAEKSDAEKVIDEILDLQKNIQNRLAAQKAAETTEQEELQQTIDALKAKTTQELIETAANGKTLREKTAAAILAKDRPNFSDALDAASREVSLDTMSDDQLKSVILATSFDSDENIRARTVLGRKYPDNLIPVIAGGDASADVRNSEYAQIKNVTEVDAEREKVEQMDEGEDKTRKQKLLSSLWWSFVLSSVRDLQPANS